MQLVPITTKVVSSNPLMTRCIGYNIAMPAISCIIIFSSIGGWSRFIVSQLGYDVKVWNLSELLFHNVMYMTRDYEFEGQSDICFVTELLNLVYRLNVWYSNPRFCQKQFMQEYPINKHEITIIVNQYLVKGDWF